jgi:ribulose-5-phosphate 4-epimerase/fuculose-1-phosphate aldolase
MEEDEFERDLEYYIEIGAVELSGVDEYGEIIFKITDAAEELVPELWQAHKDYIDQTLLDLYEKDLISVEYNENLEATITLTEEAKKIARQHGMIEVEENEKD